ncbi:KR domain-containing protein [Modestobacter altitudinis]|uniref:KR domain-containing protein n=1 Tax=Modestobacter altitudinis TaxID=2213158 RepID=UPI0034E090EA
MDITGSIALVTGADRGLGRHFAQQLLERGASRVYATSRRPELVDVPGWRCSGWTSPTRSRSPPRRQPPAT